MALNPKDLNEERLMALCRAIEHTIRVQTYILDRLRPSDEEPHRDHLRHAEMHKRLMDADTRLQIYFLGD